MNWFLCAVPIGWGVALMGHGPFKITLTTEQDAELVKMIKSIIRESKTTN